MRQAGNGRVGFVTAPIPSAAAGKWFYAEQMQGRGGVAGFLSGQRVAVKRKTVRTDERAAEAGAGHEHHHGNFFVAAREPRLGHAAIIAVVADDEWNSAA